MQATMEHPVSARRGILRIVPFWEFRDPRTWAGIGAAIALWLVVLGGALCVNGLWWGALLLPAAALRLWIAHRLVAYAQSTEGTAVQSHG
jgi:hypothetical protein